MNKLLDTSVRTLALSILLAVLFYILALPMKEMVRKQFPTFRYNKHFGNILKNHQKELDDIVPIFCKIADERCTLKIKKNFTFNVFQGFREKFN